MARTEVKQVKVTDDVTGVSYVGLDTDQDIQAVKTYRITIEQLGEDGKAIRPASLETRFVRDVDMHAITYESLCAFIDGDKRSMFELITSVLGVSLGTIGHLWSYVAGSFSAANLAESLGIKARANGSNGSGAGKSTGETFTKHVRAYAIAKGWKSPKTGKPIGTVGVITQETVNRFVTETGITAEAFAEGKRAEIPSNEADSNADATESAAAEN